MDIFGKSKCIRLTHGQGCACKIVVGCFWVLGFGQANGKIKKKNNIKILGNIALTSRISKGSQDCIFAHLHTNQPTIIELQYEIEEI